MKIALIDQEFLMEYAEETSKLALAIENRTGIKVSKPWLPDHIHDQLVDQGYGIPDRIPYWEVMLTHIKDHSNIFGVERDVSIWAEQERKTLRKLIAENEGKKQIPSDIYDSLEELDWKHQEWIEDWIAPDPLAEF